MTEAEIKLWYHLRNRNLKGLKFKRQQQVDKYIVDFISHETKLIIEVDGSQHIENQEFDRRRKKHLRIMVTGLSDSGIMTYC